MKKLELQNFGVVEMNNEEMVEVVGGSWFGRIAIALGFAAFIITTGGLGGVALMVGGIAEELINP